MKYTQEETKLFNEVYNFYYLGTVTAEAEIFADGTFPKATEVGEYEFSKTPVLRSLLKMPGYEVVEIYDTHQKTDLVRTLCIESFDTYLRTNDWAAARDVLIEYLPF